MVASGPLQAQAPQEYTGPDKGRGIENMHNVITIKTKKTEIGIGGPTGWYLITTVGRYRVERYRDVDGNAVWQRVDTVAEREARLEYLRERLANDPDALVGCHVSSDETAALGIVTGDDANSPPHAVYAPA